MNIPFSKLALAASISVCAVSFVQAEYPDCTGLYSWENDNAYNGGDEVLVQNTAYRANWWTQYSDPSNSTQGDWTLLGDCGHPVFDSDLDGVIDELDNCVLVANSDQADSDGNGVGNACDVISLPKDSDLDGVWDHEDNCVDVANPDQADSDGNGIGNTCDADYLPATKADHNKQVIGYVSMGRAFRPTFRC